MASSPPRISRTLTPTELARLDRTYRRALAQMTVPQLMDHLATINRQIEADRTERLGRVLSEAPSGYRPDLDQPVVSTPTATPLPRRDRGSLPSRPSPPRALDLLASQSRMGPRLAAKLVAASARSASRRAAS